MEIWELKVVMIGVKENSTNPELSPKTWPGFQ
jgi:hypothetical protein